jgi:hypothetical protein
MEEKDRIEEDGFGCVSKLKNKRENEGGCSGGVATLFRESPRRRLKEIHNEMARVI